MVMHRAIRVRLGKLLSVTIATLGILAAASVSFATRPSVPQMPSPVEKFSLVAPPIEIVEVPASSVPSAFGFLEFDWQGPGAIPGFGPWRNEAASVRTTEIVPTR
jgi:hypothetical protein